MLRRLRIIFYLLRMSYYSKLKIMCILRNMRSLVVYLFSIFFIVFFFLCAILVLVVLRAIVLPAGEVVFCKEYTHVY
jgi:hypothetical protein